VSAPIVSKNSSVRLPTSAADSTGKAGVYRIAVTTSANNFAIPTSWQGCFLRVQPVGCNAQVAISRAIAAPTLVINQASAPGTGNAAAGATVANGAFLDGIVPKGSTFFCYVCDGSGFLEFYMSEQLNQAVGFSQ
jgi:hypothetical protein